MEHEGVIISWTVENWITVFLMATLGFAAIALIMQLVHTARAPTSAPVSNTPPVNS